MAGADVSGPLQAKASEREREPGGPSGVRLTRRERQVLELIAEARTAREIAVQLGMSASTARAHSRSIMNKLQVRRVVALVRRAIRLGLVAP